MDQSNHTGEEVGVLCWCSFAERADTPSFADSFHDAAGVRNDRLVVALHGRLDDLDTAVLQVGDVDAVEFVVASRRLGHDGRQTGTTDDRAVGQRVEVAREDDVRIGNSFSIRWTAASTMSSRSDVTYIGVGG